MAKPDVAFFERVLDALALRASDVLFLDDRRDNVDAARRAGLAAAVYVGESGAGAPCRLREEHGPPVGTRSTQLRPGQA